jgi:hypothetical protein
MKLLTKIIRNELIKNHVTNSSLESHHQDFKPVVKFFNPSGSGTWLITELDPETNLMFGLCDLGMGFPELGYVSLDELSQVRCAFGLSIERDLYWTANKTLGEYAKESYDLGYIKT